MAWVRRWRTETDDEGSERDVRPFPSKLETRSILGLLVVATMLALVSILWQHIVSSAVVGLSQNLSYGTIRGHVGTVAMVLGWGGVFVDVLLVFVVIVQILSLALLERIMED
jgi:hypothetical protein